MDALTDQTCCAYTQPISDKLAALTYNFFFFKVQCFKCHNKLFFRNRFERHLMCPYIIRFVYHWICVSIDHYSIGSNKV